MLNLSRTHETRSVSNDGSMASDQAGEPRWASWVLALIIYAIYAVIASPAIAAFVN